MFMLRTVFDNPWGGPLPSHCSRRFRNDYQRPIKTAPVPSCWLCVLTVHLPCDRALSGSDLALGEMNIRSGVRQMFLRFGGWAATKAMDLTSALLFLSSHSFYSRRFKK